MLASEIIETGTLRVAGESVLINVRIPWYRALPLSLIAEASLAIDGMPVDPEAATWTVNGATRRVQDLPELWNEWWYVLDTATIAAPLPEGLDVEDGAEHQVDVAIGLFIPYLPDDEGKPLRIRELDTKTMPLEVSA